MSKNQKFEVKIYELLGIKLFKKAVFKLEKIIHRKDGKKNINYHIKNSNDMESVDNFKKFLYYNGAIHTKNLIFDIPVIILMIVFRYNLILIVPIMLWLIKDIYCIMLQRYNWLKINGFEEKLQVRKNKRIERRVEEIDKEKIKVNLEQKEIDKNELVAELEKMRNYLMKIKSENNELHIETFDIIEIAMDKKIKNKIREVKKWIKVIL